MNAIVTWPTGAPNTPQSSGTGSRRRRPTLPPTPPAARPLVLASMPLLLERSTDECRDSASPPTPPTPPPGAAASSVALRWNGNRPERAPPPGAHPPSPQSTWGSSRSRPSSARLSAQYSPVGASDPGIRYSPVCSTRCLSHRRSSGSRLYVSSPMSTCPAAAACATVRAVATPEPIYSAAPSRVPLISNCSAASPVWIPTAIASPRDTSTCDSPSASSGDHTCRHASANVHASPSGTAVSAGITGLWSVPTRCCSSPDSGLLLPAPPAPLPPSGDSRVGRPSGPTSKMSSSSAAARGGCAAMRT
mmetsp:Transcript_37568/g.111029  ORF Transcript_37568/g.111029 Transcript_37568/m.111029 type:complete len:305 (+) Transcript_37568:1302-2216(+)